MFAWVRESQVGKSLFAVAVLLALGLRIVVPTGFMPTLRANALVVELCSGISGKSIAIDVGKTNPGEKPQQSKDGSCVFAMGLGHGLLASSEQSTILPFVYGLTIFVGQAIADLTISRLAAPPPPSQGPPALS